MGIPARSREREKRWARKGALLVSIELSELYEGLFLVSDPLLLLLRVRR